MLPAPFDYVRPLSLAEALETLSCSPQAKIIAGGQSLVPLLRQRTVTPRLLVDIGGLTQLRGISRPDDAPGQVAVGALTTYHQAAKSAVVKYAAPLLSTAAETVGDPAVRHRGTLGGALADADPGGDLPAVVLALDAEIVAVSSRGRRTVPAGEFFLDRLTTALAPDEIVSEIRIPALSGWKYRHMKFRTTAQSRTIVGVSVLVRTAGEHVEECRIALANMGPTPLRAHLAEEAMRGRPVTAQTLSSAAALVTCDTDPPSDAHGSRAYREHLARTLTHRALAATLAPRGGAD